MIYHVSVEGHDGDAGTADRPFRTIQRAADLVRAGDTCVVHGGVYRETVTLTATGVEGKPIRFAAASGEYVRIKGTDPITGDWSIDEGAIYRVPVDRTFDQLFVDEEMMIEARWPNARFGDLLNRDTWAKTGVGSRYGRIVDPTLGATGIDWTGAVATLNVAHQFFSWTRTVVTHEAGGDSFTYEKDLPGITHFADKTTPWEGNAYYLSGKREALDTPSEWFLDPELRMLYLWTPRSDDPGEHRVEAKTRDYGFDARGLEHIRIEGFHLFGCTVRLRDCAHCVIDSCRLLFPTYAKRLTDFDADPEPTVRTLVTGTCNTIRNSSLSHSATGGLTVLGGRNTVENCLVRDFCWSGSLNYVGIRIGPVQTSGAEHPAGGGNTVRRCTVCDGGNACVSVEGTPDNVVEYCHIHDGGRACKDVSLLYTHLPLISGTVFRHNWVHGCHAPHIALGVRGDDQTRGLTVHHNVVWDCGWEGIVVKGDENRVYHNTCFGNGLMDIRIDSGPEPSKPWRKQWPLLEKQNERSETCNNCAADIRGARTGDVPPGGKASNNLPGRLADPDGFDFRPAEGSALIDAGRIIPTVNDGYRGAAPDVGAYEYGAEPWCAGHRNELVVVRRGDHSLGVALRMPVFSPVTVRLSADRADTPGSEFVFTPGDWMIPQEVHAEDIGDGALFFRVEEEAPVGASPGESNVWNPSNGFPPPGLRRHAWKSTV